MMQVRSPVGTFPVSVTAARIRRSGLSLETKMGAWGSEIRFERADLPLALAGLAMLVGAFAAGRLTAKRGGN